MAATLPQPGAPDVLYLVDLSGYVFRAYHAIAPLSSSRGEPTHAVMGTVNMLQRIVDGRRPAYFAVAMDARGPSFRKELDPRYKAHRPPAPPDLHQQMARCEQIVRAYGVPIFQASGFEADDLIACVVGRAKEAGLRVVVVSADKDLMQLVGDGDEQVLLWDTMRDKVFGPEEVQAKFGVPPSQLRDLLALTGDTSDNVPGVPGVGPKTAADLLGQFGSLDGIYAGLATIKRAKLRESLTSHEADARVSQQLVTLRADCSIEWDQAQLAYSGTDAPGEHGPDLDALRALFTELELARPLAALNASQAGGPAPVGKVAAAAPKRAAPVAAEVEVRTLLDAESLGAFVAEAKRAGRLALQPFGTHAEPMSSTTLSLALAYRDDQAVYVPLGHRYLTAPQQLDFAACCALLQPLLVDPEVTKIAFDVKSLAVLLRRQGVVLTGPLFDVGVAAYLLDPDAPQSLFAVVERELGVALVDPGAGVKKGYSLEAQEIEAVAAPLGAHAARLVPLHGRLQSALEGADLHTLAAELEFPLVHVLADLEFRGVLVDTAALGRVSERLGEEMVTLEQRAKELVGHDFSLRSRDQLETILFDELQLPVKKRTPKGGRSTDATVLDELAELHALPDVILQYREYDKLKGTYLDALPRYVQPATGRIHTRFWQTVAATGRLSSSDPNLQNIPVRTPIGREIRRAFVAPPGQVILSADYSQIELRVLAHLSQDPALVRAFTEAHDVHAYTASLIFEVPVAEVTSEMRRRAKTINFGVIYGMGEPRLARQLGIGKTEAASFIAAYFERYAGVKQFMDRTVREAKSGDAVRTLRGRRRFLPNLQSSNRGLRFEAERVAKNTPIQGTAADILKLAMLRLAEPVVPSARMILTVHDELVFEVAPEEAELASTKIRRAMEGVVELAVPLVVDVRHGASWDEAH